MAIIWRVNTEFTGITGGPYYNTLHLEEFNLTDVQTAIDGVTAFWGYLGNQLASPMVATILGEVERVESTTGQTEGVDVGTPGTVTFTNTNEPLPPATQGLIRLRTGSYVGGREVRGRVFVPGITEENSTSGRPSTAIVTRMNEAVEVLLDVFPVVYSPTRHVAPVVVGGNAWNEFAVLRSRRD